MHVDTHSAFGDEIVVVSLGAGIAFELRHGDDVHGEEVRPALELLREELVDRTHDAAEAAPRQLEPWREPGLSSRTSGGYTRFPAQVCD